MSLVTIQTLSEDEKAVFKVVQEYLDKNRAFNKSKIVPFISTRFKMASININENGITQILKSLINKKVILEGSKLTRENVLKLSKRKEIYDFIVNNPGTYFHKILKKLGFNNHIAVWHVDILIKFNYIKKELVENRFIYFEYEMAFGQAKTLHYLSKEKSKIILAYLHENDMGVTKTKISKDLNIHLNTVTKYLEVLIELRVILMENIDNKILYFSK